MFRVADSVWYGKTLLRRDVVLDFFSNMCIEIAGKYVDFVGRKVILLGQCVEEFLDFAFARAHIYTSDMDGVSYGGCCDCPRYGLM